MDTRHKETLAKFETMNRSDKAIVLNAFPRKEEKTHVQRQFLLTADSKAKIGMSKKKKTRENKVEIRKSHFGERNVFFLSKIK